MPLDGLNQVPGPYEDTTCQMVVAYGSPGHRHLKTIRRFRDSFLKSNVIGRTINDAYYNITPFIAAEAKRNEFFRKAVFYFTALPAYVISSVCLSLKGEM